MNQREALRGVHSRIDTIDRDGDGVADVRGGIRSFADTRSDLPHPGHYLAYIDPATSPRWPSPASCGPNMRSGPSGSRSSSCTYRIRRKPDPGTV